MKTKLIGIVMIVASAFYSCKKDAVPESKYYPFIILYDIRDINKEGATFVANIDNSGNHNILDYGFVCNSRNIPTVKDIVKSYGNNQYSGEFSYRMTGDLEYGKTFYVRAYVKTDKKIVYSDVRSFTSKGCLPPVINKFYPDSGASGSLITIIGENFSSVPDRNKVYFGDVPANVVKVNPDTLLVLCPNTTLTQSVNIMIEVAKQQTESELQFTLFNPWRIPDFSPDFNRRNSGYFVIGSKGYVTLGYSELINSLCSTDLWQYDVKTGQWKSLAAFPGEKRKQPVCFTIENTGYAGFGYPDIPGVNVYKDLWKYDPLRNDWSRLADFPGNYDNMLPTYFVINDKFYFFSSYNYSELWEYNPLIDKWTELPKDEVLKINWMTGGFSFDNKGYFISGSRANNYNMTFLWQFNPEQNKFAKVDTISTKYQLDGDCSFVIDNKLYIPDCHQGILMGYDLINKYLFYYNNPSERVPVNFKLVFNDRAILNVNNNEEVIEFYPR
jgi:hypothetical protein